MRKRVTAVVAALGSGLMMLVFGIGVLSGSTLSIPSRPTNTATDIFINRANHEGRINTSHQMLFGPHGCINHGDPFSPLNSPWAPGLYTYKYSISIPSGYPSDILRVELFDPDSINSAQSQATITHTNLAINLGDPAAENLQCSSLAQLNPCAIDTGEINWLGPQTLPGPTPINVGIDDINPYWLVRVDENRGAGAPPGNGTCGSPFAYNPLFNTTTIYELSYKRYTSTGLTERVPLAQYTGQVGDGVRDGGEHDSDLRWVSPGGTPSFDQPVFVPVDPGWQHGFELSISHDLPGIVTDPDSGERVVDLSIFTVYGSSENGFEIWAGPPDHIATVPSDANSRNLHLLNNPGSHDSLGVTVSALDYLPSNALHDNPVDIPLTYVSPAQAGQVISVSMFDSDSGAQPPITFFFDSISQSDWSMTFAVPGVDDPDGVPAGVRCLPGSCPTQWISPSYQIQVPNLDESCHPPPGPQVCAPFYGGSLLANYTGGSYDSYVWEVNAPEPPPLDSSAGCTAFPIALSNVAQSVTPPGVGANPYPNPSQFAHPVNPPAYSEFVEHVADVPLFRPGHLYKVQQGFDPNEFGWLLWNIGRPDDSNTLNDSLKWPGNSWDYSEVSGGSGVPCPICPLSGRTNGYVNAYDVTDTSMTVGDWVAANLGSTGSAVLATLNDHIDEARRLRLISWDQSLDGAPSYGVYRIAGFAFFRLIGHNITQGWLLFEFLGWDESCGQLIVPPQNVQIDGAAVGVTQQPYSFTAAVTPITTTRPITYVWKATGQTAITHTGGLQDVVSFTWTTRGPKMITVTAGNQGAVVTGTHQFSLGDQFTWDGGGADDNWSTPSNWSPDAVPGPADIARFAPASPATNAVVDPLFAGTLMKLVMETGYGGTIIQGRAITVSGAFSQAGGLFSGGSDPITIGGSFDLSGGAFTASAGLMKLSGDFNYSGGAFDHNQGEIRFDAAGSLTLDAGPITFHDLTVVAGTTLVENQVSDNISLNGTLANMGTIQKLKPGLFAGSAGFGLAGADIDVASGDSLAYLRAERIGQPHPQEDANGAGPYMLDSYYTLTPNPYPGSFNMELCLYYTDDELAASAVSGETGLRLCRWTGSGWQCPSRSANSSTTSNTVCAENVVALSDWTLGEVSPTAVSLQQLAIRPGSRALLFTSLLLATLLVALSLAWRRHRT